MSAKAKLQRIPGSLIYAQNQLAKIVLIKLYWLVSLSAVVVLMYCITCY
jgi:hypothetical protein